MRLSDIFHFITMLYDLKNALEYEQNGEMGLRKELPSNIKSLEEMMQKYLEKFRGCG